MALSWQDPCVRHLAVAEFIHEALEASLYVLPDSHGLTPEELCTLGSPFGFGRGEIMDALNTRQTSWCHGGDRIVLAPDGFRASFVAYQNEPEFRNVHAFEFVVAQLGDLARQHGLANAKIDTATLLARAAEAGLPGHDVKVALTCHALDGNIKLDKTVVALTHRGQTHHPPLAQYEDRQRMGSHKRQRKYL
jgi:hypothetical protein